MRGQHDRTMQVSHPDGRARWVREHEVGQSVAHQVDRHVTTHQDVIQHRQLGRIGDQRLYSVTLEQALKQQEFE